MRDCLSVNNTLCLQLLPLHTLSWPQYRFPSVWSSTSQTAPAWVLPKGCSSSRTAREWVHTMGSILQEWTTPTDRNSCQITYSILCFSLRAAAPARAAPAGVSMGCASFRPRPLLPYWGWSFLLPNVLQEWKEESSSDKWKDWRNNHWINSDEYWKEFLSKC